MPALRDNPQAVQAVRRALRPLRARGIDSDDIDALTDAVLASLDDVRARASDDEARAPTDGRETA